MMSNVKLLYEALEYGKKFADADKYQIPDYISNNLKYEFFDWQKSAFENLLLNEGNSDYKKNPTHLMFNMATGTGKTLLMAATLLYYYKQGYRHFIFFVNVNNIVDKTENNLIDNTHNKYLFKPNIIIDDKKINIKQVESFSNTPQSIEIKFTTIQKLYNDIHLERESQTTLSDLHKKDIVMFADEAHHLNADTKKKGQIESKLIFELKGNNKTLIEKKGWEDTVINLILNKNGQDKDNKNVLLEFTATVPNHDSVIAKYKSITVAKFDLKDFLSEGYTKEINLISSNLNKKQRILYALLFNSYRHKIALKHNIPNFKAVILFRNKVIADSQQEYEGFLKLTQNITAAHLDFLKTIENDIEASNESYKQEQSRLQSLLNFITNNNIKHSEIADWIKSNFKERNTIITNSKTGTSTKEKITTNQESLLNSLEDKNNHIRAIFTVNRLTEGWDVLNLFDIVRLDEGQNAGGSNKKTAPATVQEKQLIGRGVRYYPFKFDDKQHNKRKFDNDTGRELRILEELFYYSKDSTNYISDIVKALKDDGYIKDDTTPVTFKIKDVFKKTDFYKNTKIWGNQQLKNPKRQKAKLDSGTVKNINIFEYKIPSIKIFKTKITADDKTNITHAITESKDLKITSKKIKEIDKNIFYKAINKKSCQSNSLFHFENLTKEFKISTISDLLQDNYLGNFKIKFTHDIDQTISNKHKLTALLLFLENISKFLASDIHPHIGGPFDQSESFKKLFGEPKTKNLKYKKEGTDADTDIAQKEWYVLDKFVGTSEEKALVEFVKGSMDDLEKKYQEVYLLRNEEVYKIFDFKQGRGFQPDFILFLRSEGKDLYYQVFIEPKGDQFKDSDGGFANGKEGWKQEFLKEIAAKYGKNKIPPLSLENKDYYLVGLPFFNKLFNRDFENGFKNHLLKMHDFTTNNNKIKIKPPAIPVINTPK